MSTDLQALLSSKSPVERVGGAKQGSMDPRVVFGLVAAVLVLVGVGWSVGAYRGRVSASSPSDPVSVVVVDPPVADPVLADGSVEHSMSGLAGGVTPSPEPVDQSHLLQPPPVLLIVTATPSPTPVVPLREYVEVPVPGLCPDCPVCESVSCPVVSTPDPFSGLASGTVRVCVGAAGVSGMWLDGVGMVHGGCRDLAVGVGSTILDLQINR